MSATPHMPGAGVPVCDFFRSLLSELMENKLTVPIRIEKAMSYIQSPLHRKAFIQQLSAQRAAYETNELQNGQFIVLSYLFKTAFDAILLDTQAAAYDGNILLLINLSMTYYRFLGQRKQYIASLIKSHYAFSDFQFWNYAYKAESASKFKEHLMMYQHDGEEMPPDEKKEIWRNIHLNSLHFFGLAMREFGRPISDLESFVQYMNKQYKIELTDAEFKNILQPYKNRQQVGGIKDETEAERIQRIRLESMIEHDFRLARSLQRMKKDRAFLESLVQCQIADILAGDDEDYRGLDVLQNIVEEQNQQQQEQKYRRIQVPGCFVVKDI